MLFKPLEALSPSGSLALVDLVAKGRGWTIARVALRGEDVRLEQRRITLPRGHRQQLLTQVGCAFCRR